MIVEKTSARFEDGIETLQAMLAIYCCGHHDCAGELCEECRDLLEYARARLAKCPFGKDKPVCSQCTVHCYKPAMRARIREVTQYAGPRMITKHPVLAAKHVLERIRHRPRTLEKAK